MQETLLKAKESLSLNEDFSVDYINGIALEDNCFVIKRNLETREYNIDFLEEFDENLNNEIAKFIIKKYLPCILYNDDFNDRPLDTIKIPE